MSCTPSIGDKVARYAELVQRSKDDRKAVRDLRDNLFAMKREKGGLERDIEHYIQVGNKTEINVPEHNVAIKAKTIQVKRKTVPMGTTKIKLVITKALKKGRAPRIKKRAVKVDDATSANEDLLCKDDENLDEALNEMFGTEDKMDCRS